MRKLLVTCLFLTTNIVYGQIPEGYYLGETQMREKRQNNIYQFLRNLLSSSNANFGFSEINFPQFTPYQQFYQNPGHERIVVNVNQPDSKPTTIINNLQPEFFNSCPCERYVRIYNGEVTCLCPKMQIFKKCTKNTVCVLKSACDNGLLFDLQYLQHEYNRQSDLCDELTHVCCLPPTEVRKQNGFGEEHQIYNHFINSSIDSLNNTVKKYIVAGNVYVNNGNPTNQYKTEKEHKIIYMFSSNQAENMPNDQFQQPNKLQPSQTEPNQMPSNQFQQNRMLPNQFELNKMQSEELQFNPMQPVVSLSVNPENPQFNSQFPVTTENSGLAFTKEEDNRFTSTTQRSQNFKTNSPNLVRPTRPSTNDFTASETIFKSKIKTEPVREENTVMNEITTFTPKLPISTPQINTESKSDLLQPNEIASIFGTTANDLDTPVFPGLPSTQPSSNEESTTSIGVSIIENIPTGGLSTMDFPQSSLQAPMKSPQIFLTGKIEKLRNSTRMNATTTNNITQGVGKRIFSQGSQAINMFPTNAPAFNQVQEETFRFQELEGFVPPSTNPSNFAPPANTSPVLRACPTAMKCVQTMYCTPEGMVSTVPVILTKEEEERKNLLLNCGDESAGQIGKCCYDRNA